VKFIIDAQLPPKLAEALTSAGHDAVHTLNLPDKNRSSDSYIARLADYQGRVVVSKDADFVTARLIARKAGAAGPSRCAELHLLWWFAQAPALPLPHKPNIPLAVVEAKDNSHAMGAGMAQAINYAELLGVPFSFSSNGDGFVFRDATLATGILEQTP
jgi:hypothetical protein